MSNALSTKNITLVDVAGNLVDEVWETERPACGSKPIFHLEDQYSGRSTSDKIEAVRNEMRANGAELLIVTELDEVACKFSMLTLVEQIRKVKHYAYYAQGS
jgi:hypothetical protein